MRGPSLPVVAGQVAWSRWSSAGGSTAGPSRRRIELGTRAWSWRLCRGVSGGRQRPWPGHRSPSCRTSGAGRRVSGRRRRVHRRVVAAAEQLPVRAVVQLEAVRGEQGEGGADGPGAQDDGRAGELPDGEGVPCGGVDEAPVLGGRGDPSIAASSSRYIASRRATAPARSSGATGTARSGPGVDGPGREVAPDVAGTRPPSYRARPRSRGSPAPGARGASETRHQSGADRCPDESGRRTGAPGGAVPGVRSGPLTYNAAGIAGPAAAAVVAAALSPTAGPSRSPGAPSPVASWSRPCRQRAGVHRDPPPSRPAICSPGFAPSPATASWRS